MIEITIAYEKFAKEWNEMNETKKFIVLQHGSM
jgi:hypothetical protein